VSFVTSFSYRSSKLSPSLPSAIRFEVVAVPCRAGILVETSNELPVSKKQLGTLSVLSPLRFPFQCFFVKFCLKGQEWDIQGQNTCEVIFCCLCMDIIFLRRFKSIILTTYRSFLS